MGSRVYLGNKYFESLIIPNDQGIDWVSWVIKVYMIEDMREWGNYKLFVERLN